MSVKYDEVDYLLFWRNTLVCDFLVCHCIAFILVKALFTIKSICLSYILYGDDDVRFVLDQHA